MDKTLISEERKQLDYKVYGKFYYNFTDFFLLIYFFFLHKTTKVMKASVAEREMQGKAEEFPSTGGF